MSDLDVGGLLGTVIVGGMAVSMVNNMNDNNHHRHEEHEDENHEHEHKLKKKHGRTAKERRFYGDLVNPLF